MSNNISKTPNLDFLEDLFIKYLCGAQDIAKFNYDVNEERPWYSYLIAHQPLDIIELALMEIDKYFPDHGGRPAFIDAMNYLKKEMRK